MAGPICADSSKAASSSRTFATSIRRRSRKNQRSRAIAKETAEAIGDTTIGQPLPNYAYDEKKAEAGKAKIAEKIETGTVDAAKDAAEILKDATEGTTISEPLPYYQKPKTDEK